MTISRCWPRRERSPVLRVGVSDQFLTYSTSRCAPLHGDAVGIRIHGHRARAKRHVRVARQCHARGAKRPRRLRHFVRVFYRAMRSRPCLLVRNERYGVDVEDLVHAQLAPFADLIGSRITVRGPKAPFKPVSAQAIGLTLHELATNAGKEIWGLSMDRGRVDVCGRTDGHNFTMSWAEREGPPVSEPQRRGFGTIVMERMAARSVDGAVDRSPLPPNLALDMPSSECAGA
jgi:hypothetical protein